MIRETIPSNCARSMFEVNVGTARGARSSSGRGTGPDSSARAFSIVATASA